MTEKDAYEMFFEHMCDSFPGIDVDVTEKEFMHMFKPAVVRGLEKKDCQYSWGVEVELTFEQLCRAYDDAERFLYRGIGIDNSDRGLSWHTLTRILQNFSSLRLWATALNMHHRDLRDEQGGVA